ncbi:hypothetical protein C0992_002102 [Termitomyces sp. T32_za158]|nr:hypothetical protein C0992_002102 [Termitomyces sp. T32_za158]
MANLLHPSDPTTSGFFQPGGRNYDYTKIYSPDKPGEEAKENARVWNVYLDEAENYDMDMIQGFRNIIDGLLVFAALFSAVVTTFVAQTSQVLQPDNSQIMLSLLIETNQLLRAAGNQTSINAVPAASLNPESRTYNSIDVWVNGLFFTSLALSLSTALLSVLAKQWIQAYTANVAGSAKTRALTRHFRFEGLVKWKLGDIIESLPLILHCSVAVFLIGLALYISQLSRPICGVVAGITAFTFLIYFGSSIIPAFDIACPYRIPFMFPLAQLLFFVSDMIHYAYSGLCNKPRTLKSWKYRSSLKAEEQIQTFDYNLARTSLSWILSDSSNYSVNEIVMEGTCGLLVELYSFYTPMESLLSGQEDDLFVSAITYALLRLPDMSSTSSEEDEIEESTVYGRLIAALVKVSSEKVQVDEHLSHSDSWKQVIIDTLLAAYEEALKSNNHNLSRYLLEWGGNVFQLDNGWRSFLFRCAIFGNAQDFHDLVDQGIDLDGHGYDDWTALHFAVFYGNLDVIIALVEQKPALMSALANWADLSVLTPLDLAAITLINTPDVVAYLLDHGARSISHDALYCGLLARFESDALLDRVQLLLDCGWNRTVKDNEEKTLLEVAHSKGNITLADHLEHYQTVRLPPYGTAPRMDEETQISVNSRTPGAEGPCSTAASRCVADAYIQGQVKGYEKIIRYYNRCRNALNFTCRIPPEILGAIFSEVVQCTESEATSSDDIANVGHIDWIQSVTHVCSHWREVALKIPNLWSNIPLNNRPWAEEMVRRSDPVPLTIGYKGPMSVTNNEHVHRSFKTLTEIIRFHLPRIKSLTLYSRSITDLFPSDHYWTSSESISIFSLLNQPVPMMERLEVQLLSETENNKLPYELFTMSSRLRHLTLKDCGVAWDLERIDFGNLRSLELSNLRRETNPSMNQLLTILRQTSRLESLNLETRDQETGLGDSSLLPVIDPVPLRHLERITLIGGLSYCILLNHIAFSQNARSIHLRIENLPDFSSPLAQALTEKLDDGIEGSILSLYLSICSIQCWKSKDTTDIPSFHDPPTLDIGSRSPNIRIFEAGFLWRSLRLNQLILLKVDIPLEQVSWTFFGDLPQLRDICVSIFQNKFLDALYHGLADPQPVRMSFPALRNLTMVRCLLRRGANLEHDAPAPFVSVAQSMLSCFELRKKAGLPLDCLTLEQCIGIDDLQLKRLRVAIGRVECIEPEFYDEDFKYLDYGFGGPDYEDFKYLNYGFDGPDYEDEETDADYDPDYDDAYDYDQGSI